MRELGACTGERIFDLDSRTVAQLFKAVDAKKVLDERSVTF